MRNALGLAALALSAAAVAACGSAQAATPKPVSTAAEGQALMGVYLGACLAHSQGATAAQIFTRDDVPPVSGVLTAAQVRYAIGAALKNCGGAR